jgi:steroid delta-isomerase-like uncharacterized protein
MDPIALARRYFDAWNRRDAGAVLASFAPDGHYQDPVTPGPLAGDALRAYVEGLWAAFPDLAFEIGPVHRVGETEVHGRWTMIGTQRGPFQGLPPSGRGVRLEGIDVIEAGAGGLRSVLGYFDSAALPRQLGLDVVVQPSRLGPFEFGIATRVRPERAALPGAVAVTDVLARDDAAAQRIRELSRQTVTELLERPGFLQFTSAVTGRRLSTLTLWESVAAVTEAMQRGTHVQAMREFPELAEAGATHVFTAQRVGPFLQRCAACGKMNRSPERHARCACGAEIHAAC